MAKGKTPDQQVLEREVKKERKRAKQLVRRATKRGFSFPENIVPDLPKKITEATLRKYKRLTPEYLYSKAVYISPEGTVYTGSQRRSQERSKASQKAAETRQRFYESLSRAESEDSTPPEAESWQGYGPAPTPESRLVLNQLRDMIANWQPRDVWSISLAELKRKDRDLLGRTLEGIVSREGEEAVARRCQDNAEILVALADKILYDSGDSYKTRGVDGVNQQIQRFGEIIQGRPLTVRESMEYTEYGEQNTGVYE